MAAKGTVPLGIESYKRAATPEVEVVNLILEEDKSGLSLDGFIRHQRPGLAKLAQPNGVARGLFKQDGVFGGALVGAFGSKFVSVSGSTVSTLATIAGTGLVPFAATFERLLLLPVDVAQSWDGEELTNVVVPDPDGDDGDTLPVVDIETINGYAIFACLDGTFFWAAPGETDPDPLSFATVESSPDGLVGVQRVGDELWFFGRETVEVWQPTGNAEIPFQRAPGRQYDRGCRSRDTIWRFDNSVFWVGDDGIVYRGDAVPNRVSEFGIEERVRKATGPLSAMVTQMLEHKFYVLRIPGQGSFGFDPATQRWAQFTTGAGSEWAAQVAAGEIMGTTTGRVVSPVPGATDDEGTKIVTRITGTLALADRPDRFDSLTIRCAIGADGEISVRWRDGQDAMFGPPEALEVRAPYDTPNLYRMGTPDLPLRTYELSTTGSASFSIAGAQIGSGWQ